MSADAAYLELLHRAREHTMLGSCATLLEWDEDVSMPEGGGEHRAEQQALLARLLHAQATDPRMGDLLAEAEARLTPRLAPGDPAAVNLRELREEYEKARLVPASLVEDLARVTTLSYEAWRSAREQRDARVFLPWLHRVVTLKQAEADCLAGGRDRYDVVLDEWEPDLTWATLGPMLARLRAAIVPLLDRAIDGAGPLPGFLTRPVDVRLQAEISRELAEWLGFDFACGRLDEAMHPSTIRVGPGDVRLTTRFRPTAFTVGLFATLHELGHGLYEQYLPGEHFGAPVGEAPSLGLHESQARLVENHLGRSQPFWRYLWPRLARGSTPRSGMSPPTTSGGPSTIRVGTRTGSPPTSSATTFTFMCAWTSSGRSSAERSPPPIFLAHGPRATVASWASLRPTISPGASRTATGPKACSDSSRPTRSGTPSPPS